MQSLEAQIREVASGYLARGRAPGISISVASSERGSAAYAAGLADAARRVACSPITQFAIGSVTKQFTAAAVLQLVGCGSASLDVPAAEYFPEISNADARVHLRHLLTHTAGLSAGVEKALRDEGRLHVVPEQLLAAPLEFEPGTQWRYSNAGYAILGRLIERVSGRPYRGYLTHEVFQRAGLRHAIVGQDPTESAAVGHAWTARGFGTVSPPADDATFGSGSIYCSASDLVRWYGALASGAVVDHPAFSTMTTPYRLKAGESAGYGFGLFVSRFAGWREFSQDGNNGGFSAQLAAYPDAGVVIAVLTNGANHDAEAIEKALARRLLGISEPVVLDLEVPVSDARTVSGDYTGAPSPVRVWGEAGRLFVRTPGGGSSRLLYQGLGQFVQESDQGIRLAVQDDGHVVVTREGKVLSYLSKIRGL